MSPRVLVVDDEPDELALIARHLRAAGLRRRRRDDRRGGAGGRAQPRGGRRDRRPAAAGHGRVGAGRRAAAAAGPTCPVVVTSVLDPDDYPHGARPGCPSRSPARACRPRWPGRSVTHREALMSLLVRRARRPASPTGSRALRRLARHLGPDGGVVERQLPFVGVFFVALLTLLIPGRAGDQPAATSSSPAVLTVGQLVAARVLPWSRWPEVRPGHPARGPAAGRGVPAGRHRRTRLAVHDARVLPGDHAGVAAAAGAAIIWATLGVAGVVVLPVVLPSS